jgi:hypothetical protein
MNKRMWSVICWLWAGIWRKKENEVIRGYWITGSLWSPSSCCCVQLYEVYE